MNIDCKECYGTDVTWMFWKNDKKKQVSSDWVYCHTCNPDSYGTYNEPWTPGWEVINSVEFYRLKDEKGYYNMSDF
jgi:hypothetical protein